MKILVVDDLDFVREPLEGWFLMHGWQVITAENGKEGLQRYLEARDKQEPFDRVVTDFNMPEMNGLEMARAIKAHDPGAVIFLHTDQELKNCGFPVIPKPTRHSILMLLVSKNIKYPP